MEYFNKTPDKYRELGIKKNIANSLNELGIIQTVLGNYEETLEIQRKIRNERTVFAMQVNVGNAYKSLNNHHEALPYYRRGLEIAESTGNKIASSILAAEEFKENSDRALIITQLTIPSFRLDSRMVQILK
jgi:tetratricopeptide (TPR) repeat protein